MKEWIKDLDWTWGEGLGPKNTSDEIAEFQEADREEALS
jgi:hypothetical protein